jgi:hypothetical protein
MKMLVYDKSLPIDKIAENEKGDDIDYLKPEHEKSALTPCLLAQLHPNEPIRDIFTTEVITHFFQGRMTLSIENCVFVERYTKCAMSQLLDLVCDQ